MICKKKKKQENVIWYIPKENLANRNRPKNDGEDEINRYRYQNNQNKYAKYAQEFKEKCVHNKIRNGRYEKRTSITSRDKKIQNQK